MSSLYLSSAVSSPVTLSAAGSAFNDKLKDLGQPEKLLSALDYYYNLEESDKIQRRTSISTLLMATPLISGMAANAVNLASSCKAGAAETSLLSCGAAAASLGGVLVGFAGAALGFVNLRAQSAQLVNRRLKLDEELFQKLTIPANLGRLVGSALVSEFSVLTGIDKKIVREQLRIDGEAIALPQ